MNLRIIPRLDIKGSNLVKGIYLEGLRVLGKPEDFARLYYENGADELFYMDTVASLYGRNNILEIVERTSREIFIPLTVGGGLRTLEDIQAALRAGADKVSLNTAVLARPELIREATQAFGSSTVVVTIEAMKCPSGRYECYTDNGRCATGVDAFDWARRAEDLGAGELCITSVDREGTGLGFDLTLIQQIAEAVQIPIIAHGGAGSVGHVLDLIRTVQVNAVALASILHYEVFKSLGSQAKSFQEGNTNFLRSGAQFSKVQSVSLSTLKTELLREGISCRDISNERGVQA